MSDLARTQDSSNERSAAGVAERGSPDWYAVRVRPRAEKLVAAGLRSKQYEEFLPLYQKRSHWSDRVKLIESPLFPGYVFCRADLSGRPPLVTTPSVIGILSFGGRPAVISEQEISAVRAVIGSGCNSEPWPYINQGDRVRIFHGPLAGIEGVLVRSKRDWRIVLSVDVLSRSIGVEVDRAWVRPVTSSKTLLYAC